MPETVLVDVEALIVAHFKADADLIDVIGSTDNVGTELPADYAGGAFVELRRLGGSLITPETARLERARIFVAAWGATKPAAWDAASAAMTAANRMPDVPHDLGVVTAVDLELTPYYSPDPEDDTPRYLATIAATVHPR